MMQLRHSRDGYSIHNRPLFSGQPHSSSSMSSSAYDRCLVTAAPKPRKTAPTSQRLGSITRAGNKHAPTGVRDGRGSKNSSLKLVMRSWLDATALLPLSMPSDADRARGGLIREGQEPVTLWDMRF